MNLRRSKDIRFKIRNLARKRFVLGYPPRKDSDTSIGDAVNWEWMIHCASEAGRNLIVVSRDYDYGQKFNDDSIINDWLSQEFKERVSRQRKIILTDKLMHAFKLAKIKVAKEEEKAEEELIEVQSKKVEERRREIENWEKKFYEMLRKGLTKGSSGRS